ncbi:atrial natriuretic peptide receptor 2-like [Octopus vulgaris]|uniref:Guanylate cyclase n=1 Tax=Octopus vulgaris TaxID=6645 RepID=A0AA36BGC7_OCTVU|nr:atrial natriuretic peptide receptor 2-like [Octopus vulgaris]
MNLERKLQEMPWIITYESLRFADTKPSSNFSVLSVYSCRLTADDDYQIVTRSAFLNETKGMNYIHKSDLAVHGNLKSSNCLIDNRWVLKIADFGIPSIRRKRDKGELSMEKILEDQFWTAPEHLREIIPGSSQKGDMYSFGIILYEIITRSGPYECDTLETANVILNRIKKTEDPPLRPLLPEDFEIPGLESKEISLKDLLSQTWHEQAELRPTFHKIWQWVLSQNKGRKLNMVDSLIGKLERYANNLEEVVEQRTKELIEEKKKTDDLLYQMLPRQVAEQLKKGQVVNAELFNDVETIGDAYMVVSGLPIRNGRRHAVEIANMALDLLSCILEFTVTHQPDHKLLLRIGLHTGPCAAGVVGTAMPRYCLFGDTVNMASRMESTGER